jgi:hypothetical protein
MVFELSCFTENEYMLHLDQVLTSSLVHITIQKRISRFRFISEKRAR